MTRKSLNMLKDNPRAHVLMFYGTLYCLASLTPKYIYNPSFPYEGGIGIYIYEAIWSSGLSALPFLTGVYLLGWGVFRMGSQKAPENFALALFLSGSTGFFSAESWFSREKLIQKYKHSVNPRFRDGIPFEAIYPTYFLFLTFILSCIAFVFFLVRQSERPFFMELRSKICT